MESHDEDATWPAPEITGLGRPVCVATGPTVQRLDVPAPIAASRLHGKGLRHRAGNLVVEKRTVIEATRRVRRAWQETAPRDFRIGMLASIRLIDLIEKDALDCWEWSLRCKPVDTKKAVRRVNGRIDLSTGVVHTGDRTCTQRMDSVQHTGHIGRTRRPNDPSTHRWCSGIRAGTRNAGHRLGVSRYRHRR